MKTIFKFFIPCLAVAFALTSCEDTMDDKAEIDAKYEQQFAAPSVTINTAEADGPFSVKVNATVPAAKDIYQQGVQVSVDDKFEDPAFEVNDTVEATYTVVVNGLEAESTYYMRAFVIGRNGNIAYSEARQVTTTGVTYSVVGTGTYYYGASQLSDGAESFMDNGTTAAATLYACDQVPGNYYITPWATGQQDLYFTIQSNGTIKFNQDTGYTYGSYGNIFFMDIEAYNAGYKAYLGKYDEEKGIYYFNGIYQIPGVGGFGLIVDAFVLDKK